MKSFQLLFAAAAILSLSLIAQSAQQPAIGRKRVPTLTTDDVVRSRPAQVEESAPGEPNDAAATGAPKSEAVESKTTQEESYWREMLRLAREKAKSLEREAEETELRLTALRNEMGISGQSSRDRNEIAAELEAAGKYLVELRAQARAAAEELNQLLEHGRQKGFSEAEGPKPTSDDGKPNEEFYRRRFAQLTETLQTAERRVQLYDNRVRDFNQRITSNSGSGDNFYIMQLQQERDEAQKQLQEATAARNAAQNDIDALMEEARRAGVPPGVFR